MKLSDITPLLICHNEEANLMRTLAGLDWASRIVVVDSGSTDGTLALLAADPRICLRHRAFDRFAEQCSAGLVDIDSDWVLSLDADYVLTAAFVDELSQLEPDVGTSGYTAPFIYCINGTPLSASLLPPRVVLFRLRHGHFENDGHSHRIVLDGSKGALKTPIYHDDRKPLSRWLSAQIRYATPEAEKLLVATPETLNRADRLRLRLLAPLAVLPYCLLVCGLWRDGRIGWFYSLQRLYSEVLLALVLIERRASR